MGGKSDKLFGTNDEIFWSVWKQCDEKIAPNINHIVVMEKKWETYYANLYSNPIRKNKNCPTILNHKKISKENSILLNKMTSHQELKKILKILKNGKSPGIDRISNEMIKHSFEILKDCFVKLFNLVITVGCVPSIWCKGLITPVHKKGDPLNPDNFRPICVLSCLCKFFTNVLNSIDWFVKMKN